MTYEARLGGLGGSIALSELRVGSPLIQPARVQSKPGALVWAKQVPGWPRHQRVLDVVEFAGLRQELGVKGWDEGQAQTQVCRPAIGLTLGFLLLPRSSVLFPFHGFCSSPTLSPSFCCSIFIIFPSFIFHAHPTLCLVNFSCLRFVFNALILVTSPSLSPPPYRCHCSCVALPVSHTLVF